MKLAPFSITTDTKNARYVVRVNMTFEVPRHFIDQLLEAALSDRLVVLVDEDSTPQLALLAPSINQQ